MAEPIRLVVWDLDETFWRGALTEGGIVWRDECREIVAELSRRGIMSSICSKNDFETVKALLVERGAWDDFIFPSIDWSPKGPRIQQIIETVQLRPQTVMLIDDNHLNLEEAKFFAPGIQVAADTFIPSILADPLFTGKDDRDLSRLKQYKVLEKRKADEAQERETTGGDNRGFLRGSEIRVRIENDVEAHLDRAIELINRTNQLNFIKRRLPEDIDLARERLRAELSDFATQAGLIHVSDKYGDYGFCGYFQVSTRREVAQLRQFCFSCRILDMGVEAWVYQRLGKPALEVQGEVLSDPLTHPPVDWISVGTETARTAAQPSAPSLGSVAARGGCVLWPLVHYFRLTSEQVIGEFNTVRDGKVIMLDRSLCLRNAILGVTPEQIEAIAPLGYVAEDFQTEYFDYSGDKPIWILSNWADLTRRVYRHNRTGIVVPCHPPRTETAKAQLEDLQDYLSAEFTLDVVREAEFKETLALIFSKVPRHGLMFLLQITEADRRPDGEQVSRPHRREFNRWCAEAAAPFSNVRLVPVADFVHNDAEILNQNNTHFDRRVYHRLYLHILEAARADLQRVALEAS
jgi:FkbH-like protein